MRKILEALPVLLILAGLCRAQTMTLHRLFQRIRDVHPGIRQLELLPEIQKRNRELASAARNWRISSTPSWLYSRPVNASSFTPDEMQEIRFSSRWWSWRPYLSE